jgi:hypothetical protein
MRQAEVNLRGFLQVTRTHHQAMVVSGANGYAAGEVDGRRHDESVVVVCMLADEIDPAGSAKDARPVTEQPAEGIGERRHEGSADL